MLQINKVFDQDCDLEQATPTREDITGYTKDLLSNTAQRLSQCYAGKMGQNRT